jgi:hypothetical protein
LNQLTGKFQALSQQDSWANARDVEELAKKTFYKFGLSSQKLTLTENLVLKIMEDMMTERQGRMDNKKPTATGAAEITKAFTDNPTFTLRPATTDTTLATEVKESGEPEASAEDPSHTNRANSIRDAGVSDEVWEQLQRDKEKEDRDDEELRRLKQAQRTAMDADRERLMREILAEEDKRKKMEEAKSKLKNIGICPAGFHWIKQNGGYRCAGGFHWVSDEQVAKM